MICKRKVIMEKSIIKYNFCMLMLILSGDVELNPGPGDNILCGSCTQLILEEKKSIKCDGVCKTCFHIECVKIKIAELKVINSIPSLKWLCPSCDKDCDGLLKSVMKSIIDDALLNINAELLSLKEMIINNCNKSCDNSDVNKNKSYSEVVKTVYKQNKDVVLILPKNKQDSKETRKEVEKLISPSEINVGISKVKNVREGGIAVLCAGRVDAGKLLNEVGLKLGDSYTSKVPALINPQIKIIGISEKYTDIELKDALLKQNSCFDKEISIVKVKIIRKMKTKYMAIFETDYESFQQIIGRGELNIGWDSCPVYEHVNVLRCYNCCEYGHKKEDCKNENACIKCGDFGHSYNLCSNDINKCINCTKTNKRLNLVLDVNHTAYDFNCSVFKKKVEIQRNRIKYA